MPYCFNRRMNVCVSCISLRLTFATLLFPVRLAARGYRFCADRRGCRTVTAMQQPPLPPTALATLLPCRLPRVITLRSRARHHRLLRFWFFSRNLACRVTGVTTATARHLHLLAPVAVLHSAYHHICRATVAYLCLNNKQRTLPVPL